MTPGQAGPTRENRDWRNACVVRAQTSADGVRTVEFAVEGPLPAFVPGACTCIQVDLGGAIAVRSYVCLPAGHGHVRVAVRDNGRGGGARYMWTLIEGARVRLTAPAVPRSAAGRVLRPGPLAPDGCLAMRGVRLGLFYGGRRIAGLPGGAREARVAVENDPGRPRSAPA